MGAFADRVVTAQPQPERASTQARGITKPATDPWGTFTQISGGSTHTCALNSAGTAYCWGLNDYGNLGDGTTTNNNAPIAVSMPAGVTFTSITAGVAHTCAITSTGTAYCWGYNVSGQLGDGTTTNRTTPVVVSMPAGVTFASIS
ncbi:MAG: RCC1 domain-containing protein, partial [Roseiflexaceae bacterium]